MENGPTEGAHEQRAVVGRVQGRSGPEGDRSRVQAGRGLGDAWQGRYQHGAEGLTGSGVAAQAKTWRACALGSKLGLYQRRLAKVPGSPGSDVQHEPTLQLPRLRTGGKLLGPARARTDQGMWPNANISPRRGAASA